MLGVVRRNPSAILLAVQVAGVLIYPFAEDTRAGRALFSLLGVVILILVVLTVRRSPALTWVSVLLGIPAVILLLIQAITGSDDLLPYSSAFEAVIYFYAAGAMIAYMLGDHKITRDELFAIGKWFAVEHVHIYRIADGRIAEHWVVRDDLGMMLQTGAISTAG